MKAIGRHRWLYLMVLPGLAYFLIFRYWPMYGLTIAFKDYLPFLGYSGSPWVGLQHFEELFTGPDFGRLMVNTLVLALLTLLFVFPAPIVVALLLNEVRQGMVKRSVQSLIYIPHFLSWTIVASLTYLLFSVDYGVIAQFIHGIVGGRQVDYVAQEAWFRPIIVLQSLWKQTGWGTIVYLAALAGVDTQLYEAARVDGASRWRQLWHVTVPGIRGLIILLLILRLGDSLTVGFEQIILQQNLVGRPASEVLDTYVYNNGVLAGQWGVSAAVGLVKGLVGVALVIGANKVAHIFGEAGVYRKS